jgi:biopolymer transport protein ExbD
MRFKTPDVAGVEPDMTPMIDIVFQLIAFFMVVINFSAVNADERIKLPVSALARPAETPPEEPLALNLDARGLVLYNGQEIPLERFGPYLQNEKQLAEYRRQAAGADKLRTTVIIRAGRDIPFGRVQQLIEMCQDQGFETYSLRAKQED